MPEIGGGHEGIEVMLEHGIDTVFPPDAASRRQRLQIGRVV